jgi:transposase
VENRRFYASSKVRSTYRELRKRRVPLLQHTIHTHKVRKAAQFSGEANRLLAVTRVSGQTLSSAAERSAVAAAVAIGGTALGARPEVEEAAAERKESGRGKRSLEKEGAEEGKRV